MGLFVGLDWGITGIIWSETGRLTTTIPSLWDERDQVSQGLNRGSCSKGKVPRYVESKESLEPRPLIWGMFSWNWKIFRGFLEWYFNIFHVKCVLDIFGCDVSWLSKTPLKTGRSQISQKSAAGFLNDLSLG